MGYERHTLLVRYDDMSRLARCRVHPESVGKDWSSHNETIITLLADTGLRVSELVALKFDDQCYAQGQRVVTKAILINDEEDAVKRLKLS